MNRLLPQKRAMKVIGGRKLKTIVKPIPSAGVNRPIGAINQFGEFAAKFSSTIDQLEHCLRSSVQCQQPQTIIVRMNSEVLGKRQLAESPTAKEKRAVKVSEFLAKSAQKLRAQLEKHWRIAKYGEQKSDELLEWNGRWLDVPALETLDTFQL